MIVLVVAYELLVIYYLQYSAIIYQKGSLELLSITVHTMARKNTPTLAQRT